MINDSSSEKGATNVLNLTITADSRQYPYEKRYPASMTLKELKEKLQLVVGLSSECMRLELWNKEEKFVSKLFDNNATLENLGVQNDSVRVWKRREGLGTKSNVHDVAEKEAKQFKVGDRCLVHLPNQLEKRGVISYIGLTKFKPGYWIGVTYDAPVGKHDGSVDGERYFTCESNHGAFVRPREVEKYEQEDEMEEI